MLLNRPMKRIGYGFKLKAASGQTRKTNEKPLTHTTAWWLPMEMGMGGVVKGAGGQIYGDKRRFVLG